MSAWTKGEAVKDTWIKGEVVKDIGDLVIGDTYHIEPTSKKTAVYFSGTAKLASYKGTSIEGVTAFFGNLVPNDKNLMPAGEIDRYNKNNEYWLAKSELTSRTFKTIKFDIPTPPIETPISPEEGERMIKEIQDVYEFLD